MPRKIQTATLRIFENKVIKFSHDTFNWECVSDKFIGIPSNPKWVHVDGNHFFLCGGYDNRTNETLDSTFMFDCETLNHIKLPPMITPRKFHSVC